MNYTPLDIDRVIKSYLVDDLENMLLGVSVFFGLIIVFIIFQALG